MPRSAFSRAALGPLLLCLLLSCSAGSATRPSESSTTPDNALAQTTPPAQHADASPDASPAPGALDQSSNPHASPPVLASSDDVLVDLGALAPGLRLDMRYAGTNNFVKQVVYPVAKCLVRKPVADALVQVQEDLRAHARQLLIWDCYRPFSVQERFWKLRPDARYVAQPIRKAGLPAQGSKHNRGAAVDVSLLDSQGRPVQMPTDHDDFSERAHRQAAGVPAQARANAELLEQLMLAHGFTGIDTEWWHFDFSDWQRYPLSDQALEP